MSRIPINFSRMSLSSLHCITGVMVLALAGCGGETGPKRYSLSGTVTYLGQPLKHGELTLTPNSAQQNEGPGSFCIIKDGEYATPAGRGIVGGPYVLTITGYDQLGDNVSPLFTDYREEVDFPKEDTTYSIEIPEQKE